MNKRVLRFLKLFLASLASLALFSGATFLYAAIAALAVSTLGSKLGLVAGLITAALFALVYMALLAAVSISLGGG